MHWPQLPPSVLNSNLNVSTSTYRSTSLPRLVLAGRTAGRHGTMGCKEWRVFGPCLFPRFGVWGFVSGWQGWARTRESKSVPRSQECQGLGVDKIVGRVGKPQEEKKKKSKISTLCSGLGLSLCPPAMAWHGVKSGPTLQLAPTCSVAFNPPTSPALALLGEAHPLFPQIPKSENRPEVP